MNILYLLMLSFSALLCTKEEPLFVRTLDAQLASADGQYHRTAFPRADLAFDSSTDLFDGLAHRDTGYLLQGVTWMWNLTPGHVLVLRARPYTVGGACIELYEAQVIVYYADVFKLPAVRRNIERAFAK